MKKMLKVLLLLLFSVSFWGSAGKEYLTTDAQPSVIKSEISHPHLSQFSSGNTDSFLIHQKAEEAGISFSTSTAVDILLDSRDDRFGQASLEAAIQRYASLLLRGIETIIPDVATPKLLFPFHYFL